MTQSRSLSKWKARHAVLVWSGILLNFAVVLPLMLANAGVAHAGSRHGAKVTVAERHGSLPSLRGVMFRPDDFAKSPHSHPAHPIPFLDGNGNQADDKSGSNEKDDHFGPAYELKRL